MSARNGDKSRHNRQRKMKIARRLRNEALAAPVKPQAAKSKAAPRS